MADRLPLTDDLAALLNRALSLSKFFPNLNKRDLEQALQESALYLYPKGAQIISEGQEGKDLFVIFKGSASVYRDQNGARQAIGKLQAGDLFGEVGLMRDGHRTATVIAEETSSIFRLTYSDIAYHLRKNPQLGEHLRSIANGRSAPPA